MLPDDDLDVTTKESQTEIDTETASEVNQVSVEDNMPPSDGAGMGIMSKLLFFGVICGIVAVMLRTRSNKATMGEKSYA